ncbi:MAG: hypothetical protein HY549_04795 [Elusimicrobia bacterium]|nr:hypothetical protein [Elusimicrobiota bacterium]
MRWLPAIAVVMALGACGRDFHISGIITVASPLRFRVPKTNAVLFIVAKNRGGVPVAVGRIVNPQFPVSYSLGPHDLLVPDNKVREPLVLHVQMNNHGNLGKPAKGDLEGECPDLVYPGDRSAHIVIDRISG